MSLMAPFQSAWKNKAMDQLEGMVGTLRVNAARLVSPEAYWVFTGDDFDLKISDPKHPSYLVIANDPDKEQDKQDRYQRDAGTTLPSDLRGKIPRFALRAVALEDTFLLAL